MKIVLLGPPGAGKGTLANLLKETFDLWHVSTGDILREEMKNKTKLGKEVNRYVDQGALVPDEVVTEIIKNKFKNNGRLQQGFMLDGFPRTGVQAEELDKILSKEGQPLDFALYMKASLPVILGRLTGRRVCRSCGSLYHIINKPPKKANVCDECGGELYQRPDDNEETIRTRMKVYTKSTKPIIDYYKKQNKLKTVNADLDAQTVLTVLMSILDENKKSHQHKNSR